MEDVSDEESDDGLDKSLTDNEKAGEEGPSEDEGKTKVQSARSDLEEVSDDEDDLNDGEEPGIDSSNPNKHPVSPDTADRKDKDRDVNRNEDKEQLDANREEGEASEDGIEEVSDEEEGDFSDKDKADGAEDTDGEIEDKAPSGMEEVSSSEVSERAMHRDGYGCACNVCRVTGSCLHLSTIHDLASSFKYW